MKNKLYKHQLLLLEMLSLLPQKCGGKFLGLDLFSSAMINCSFAALITQCWVSLPADWPQLLVCMSDALQGCFVVEKWLTHVWSNLGHAEFRGIGWISHQMLPKCHIRTGRYNGFDTILAHEGWNLTLSFHLPLTLAPWGATPTHHSNVAFVKMLMF